MERIEEKTTIYTRQHWSRAREGGWWDVEIKKKKIFKREKKKINHHHAWLYSARCIYNCFLFF